MTEKTMGNAPHVPSFATLLQTSVLGLEPTREWPVAGCTLNLRRSFRDSGRRCVAAERPLCVAAVPAPRAAHRQVLTQKTVEGTCQHASGGKGLQLGHLSPLPLLGLLGHLGQLMCGENHSVTCEPLDLLFSPTSHFLFFWEKDDSKMELPLARFRLTGSINAVYKVDGDLSIPSTVVKLMGAFTFPASVAR